MSLPCFEIDCHFSHDATDIKSHISSQYLCALSIFITLYHHGESHSLHILSAPFVEQKGIFLSSHLRRLKFKRMKNNSRCTKCTVREEVFVECTLQLQCLKLRSEHSETDCVHQSEAVKAFTV